MMDISSLRKNFADTATVPCPFLHFLQIAEELRSSVYSETGLTCSAGVAANRLLAKVLFICAYPPILLPKFVFISDFPYYMCQCDLYYYLQKLGFLILPYYISGLLRH